MYELPTRLIQATPRRSHQDTNDDASQMIHSDNGSAKTVHPPKETIPMQASGGGDDMKWSCDHLMMKDNDDDDDFR
jgi:hypothetical protein